MTALAAARDLGMFLRRHGGRTPASAAVVLDGLRAVVPSDCLALSVWDPVSGRHRSLASSYPASVTGVLDTGMHTDPLFALVRRSEVPVRVRDLPARRRTGLIFNEVITPSGFRDGVTQCLYAVDGRYVGMVNASTSNTRHPDDDTVALLGMLAADLAAGLDGVPRLSPPTTGLGDDGREGLLLRPDGRVVALSAGADTTLLGPSSLLLRETDRSVDDGRGRRLVLRGSGVCEVEFHRADAGIVVVYREVDLPAGLTVRELQVLALLSDGSSNREIAAVLGIGARTVATHVDHTLHKIGCRTRAAAAATAARWGLLV